MAIISKIITLINIPANLLGKLLFFVGILPGWLSMTLISAASGVLLLLVFKYTSRQDAIGRIRDGISAHLLAVKLFKDSLAVTLESLGRVFRGAFLLLFHSVVPLLVMIVPVSLLLAQMGLWYQYRPLQAGEQALITLTMDDAKRQDPAEVALETNPAFEVVAGPVTILSRGEVLWEVKPIEEGCHDILFHVNGLTVEKKLAVGSGFMKVSRTRPGNRWAEIFANPLESPFPPGDAVQSVTIGYPERSSSFLGVPLWIIYFFVISLVVALLFRPFLKVRI